MRITCKIITLLLILAIFWTFLTPSILTFAQDKTSLTINPIGPYLNNVTPEVANRMFVEVRNNGTTDINNIRFSNIAPDGWTVEIQPAILPSLTVGSSNTIDVLITPGETVRTGEYTITLIAEAEEIRTVTSIFLRVEGTAYPWVWIGAGIAVLVIIGFIIVFLRAGRQ